MRVFRPRCGVNVKVGYEHISSGVSLLDGREPTNVGLLVEITVRDITNVGAAMHNNCIIGRVEQDGFEMDGSATRNVHTGGTTRPVSTYSNHVPSPSKVLNPILKPAVDNLTVRCVPVDSGKSGGT